MILNSVSSPFLSRLLWPLLVAQGVGVLGLAIISGDAVWAQEVSATPMEPATTEAIAAPITPATPNHLSTDAFIDPAPTAAPIQAAGDGYIDSTNYSLGATQRSTYQPRIGRSPNAPTSVQVGPMAVGNYGLTFGRTTPSARDYYFRTVRPMGRISNNNIRLIFPLAIPAPITSLFGWRTHPITGEQRFHSGTDLGAPIGTPVLAAYAGRVALADFLGGYGLTVLLEHSKATQQTLYGHLSEVFVKPGEWVKQGVVIGRVGDTGLSTGPHLHFEFHQQTSEGWVALDAGTELEYALAQLMQAMGVAQLPPAPPSQTLKLDLSATMDLNLQEQS